jgi:AAA family ATP:ADP antiporter
MLFILFFICFDYSILRNMKDSLVITASGAAVIPFIKVWVMLPTAVLLTYLFTRLSNRFSQENVFYIMVTLFLTFFALFAFVLYPLREGLHPTDLGFKLKEISPPGFHGLIAMCCNWSFTGFYVMSELWSTAIMSVLFWGFANEITSVTEAKRFYGVLGVGASCAAIFAGQTANFLVSPFLWSESVIYQQDPWGYSIKILVALVILGGVISMALFRWMSRNVLTEASFAAFHSRILERKNKKKASLRESFAYIANSKYLICIAVIVVAYNLVIHMTEVLWKDQLARLYPSPTDYNMYMNNLTSAIGLCATLTALFMAKIIEKLGWTRTALITPIMMACTCVGFFSFFLWQDYWTILFPAMTIATPLVISVFFGAAQNCLSKAAKYSVFDATKEMAFIPLEHDCKLKGKAAIDGIGSRLGKSGGAICYQGLLLLSGTVSGSAPYVALLLGVVLILWMWSVRLLGGQFDILVASQKSGSSYPSSDWVPTQNTRTA